MTENNENNEQNDNEADAPPEGATVESLWADVKALRKEAGDHRVARKTAEDTLAERDGQLAAVRERTFDLEVREHARDHLKDPADLTKFTDAETLRGEDGEPDPEKMRTAAEGLAKDRPELAARQFAPVPQGAQGQPTPPTADLGTILRDAAG